MLLLQWPSCPSSDFVCLFIYLLIYVLTSDVMPAELESRSYSENCKKVKIHNEGTECSATEFEIEGQNK